MLDNIKKNIFKITACPDMADETFLAQSGTALAYKLVGFENVASGIVARFKKALQRRIELICNILNLKATDAVWRDVQINFVRNLPVNMTEIITMVNALKGTVSDATLLAQIPFITDVQAELEALAEQEQRKMSLYSFDTHTHIDTVEDTEETEETEAEA
jgi:SPP1 family phage portal protein